MSRSRHLDEPRRKLYVYIIGLVLMTTAIMAISARDDSVSLPIVMAILTVGGACFLARNYALPITAAVWLGANYIRVATGEEEFFNTTMLLELPVLVSLAMLGAAVRSAVRMFEAENVANRLGVDAGLNASGGIYDERSLRPAIEAALARSHRYGRSFAFVMVGIDERHQRFAFRDEEAWSTSYQATAQLLTPHPQLRRPSLPARVKWLCPPSAGVQREGGDRTGTPATQDCHAH